jgi:hypothetical protein
MTLNELADAAGLERWSVYKRYKNELSPEQVAEIQEAGRKSKSKVKSQCSRKPTPPAAKRMAEDEIQPWNYSREERAEMNISERSRRVALKNKNIIF